MRPERSNCTACSRNAVYVPKQLACPGAMLPCRTVRVVPGRSVLIQVPARMRTAHWGSRTLLCMQVPAGSKVLDIGAGPGEPTTTMAKRMPEVLPRPAPCTRVLYSECEIFIGTP